MKLAKEAGMTLKTSTKQLSVSTSVLLLPVSEYVFML